MELATIHPFPARMAPELARDALKMVPADGKVLDPDVWFRDCSTGGRRSRPQMRRG